MDARSFYDRLSDNLVVLPASVRTTSRLAVVASRDPRLYVPNQAAAWVFNFEGDRIKESRQYFDMVTFLSQIGAMPQ